VTTIEALPTWTIDPVHSSVEFSLEYMSMSIYRTGFRALEGELRFDPARPAEALVTATIPVASVDVTNERLMGRLMDPDFFAGKDHPTIAFRSTRVEPADAAHWTIHGDLTMHGITLPVMLDTRYLGQGKHPVSGKTVGTFRAETAIDRQPFGVTFRAPLEGGGTYVGDRVTISLVIAAMGGPDPPPASDPRPLGGATRAA
jgi:polyisoprenoid-binding protein YceI